MTKLPTPAPSLSSEQAGRQAFLLQVQKAVEAENKLVRYKALPLWRQRLRRYGPIALGVGATAAVITTLHILGVF